MISVHARENAHKGPSHPGSEEPWLGLAQRGRETDLREQLVNDGLVGPIEQVSTPIDLITRVRALMIDVDGQYLAPHLVPQVGGSVAEKLCERTIYPWLSRHPVLRKAEVRFSGSWIHLLLWMDPVVEFAAVAERRRWAGMVRAIQRSLPCDPHAPDLNSLTRPVGSRNSKTGLPVRILRPGEPVQPNEIIAFYEALRDRPFSTVARILYGSDRVAPCPLCRQPGSSLSIQDKVGRCYSCGTVHHAQLLSLFVAGPVVEEVSRGQK